MTLSENEARRFSLPCNMSYPGHRKLGYSGKGRGQKSFDPAGVGAIEFGDSEREVTAATGAFIVSVRWGRGRVACNYSDLRFC
jgi:hypothetical protein